MLVKKYFGRTTRDALRQVREELGADALILSNRPLASGGIEIMAVADGDVSALAQSLATAAVNRHAPEAAESLAAFTGSGLATPATAQAKPLNSAVMGHALARTYAVPVEPLDEPEHIPPAARPLVTPAAFQPDNPFPNAELTSAVAKAGIAEVETDESPSETAEPEEESPPKAVPFRESVIGRYEERAAAEIAPSGHFADPATTALAQQKDSQSVIPNHLRAPETDSELLERKEEPDPALEKLDLLNEEIKTLRSILQGQLASLAWANFENHEPVQAELFRQLLAAGMSPALCRQLVAKLPTQFSDEAALKWAKSALAHNVLTIPEQEDVVAKGGLYALVGPTGVGKTTTVAKLAARCTIRHGADRVALITTDSYRIGAQDQLRLYGKILGVSVYSVQNEADLNLTLADLGSKHHVVLIDSVGMGQRDSRVNGQIEMFANSVGHGGKTISRILVLAANSDGHTLEDVVRRYRGNGLAGCIISKLDEAVSAGPSLDTLIRHRLPVYYVTNGQRVPEDLHLPNAQFLVDRAFKATREPGPYSLKRDEYQLVQAAQASWS